jgi:hypothetical protein
MNKENFKKISTECGYDIIEIGEELYAVYPGQTNWYVARTFGDSVFISSKIAVSPRYNIIAPNGPKTYVNISYETFRSLMNEMMKKYKAEKMKMKFREIDKDFE